MKGAFQVTSEKTLIECSCQNIPTLIAAAVHTLYFVYVKVLILKLRFCS